MARIAVVTYYAVTNIGDRILTEVLCWLLKGNRIKIVDLNGRYAYKYHGLLGKIEKALASKFIKRNSKEKKNAYFSKVLRDKDIIIFGGGQILDMQYTDCSENILSIVRIAERYNIPVALHSIGLGGNDSLNKKAENIRSALSSKNIISISVRERKSDVENFLPSDSKIRIEQIADTAVWAKECYNVKSDVKFPYKKVGINVIRRQIYEENFKDLNICNVYCRLYADLSSKGYDVKFFTNGVASDKETLSDILSRLGLNDSYVITPPNKIQEKAS